MLQQLTVTHQQFFVGLPSSAQSPRRFAIASAKSGVQTHLSVDHESPASFAPYIVVMTDAFLSSLSDTAQVETTSARQAIVGFMTNSVS